MPGKFPGFRERIEILVSKDVRGINILEFGRVRGAAPISLRQVSFFSFLQFVTFLKFENVRQGGDFMLDLGKRLGLIYLGGRVFHGRNSASQEVVGPDYNTDAAFPKRTRRRLKVFCGNDYNGAAVSPLLHKGFNLPKIRAFAVHQDRVRACFVIGLCPF